MLRGHAPIKEMGQWTAATLKIWKKIQSGFGLPKKCSPLTNIGYMRTFMPSNLDAGFKWSEHGLTSLYQILDKDNLRTFEQLKNDFHIPKTDFFRYLQLRPFLTTQKEWEKFRKPTPIENYLIKLKLGNKGPKIVGK
ncbi:hypothetical protein F7725_007663 [Dissostichus mawsoni]|uniref:Uncharacterized protein n=1 Tax=Dissostichus mawsoni TaxID=36200 RepID=A0A7J5Y542_DISMA|nr:hypothetical protein F7725_007663 [Dissostichus mawsoni]